MKNIIKSALLVVMSLTLMTACSDDNDSNPSIQTPTEFKLNTPALVNTPIDLANSSKIMLTCSQPNYGYTASVQYTVQVATDENMTDAVELSETSSSAKVAINASSLASALTNIFVEKGKTEADFPMDVKAYFRLKANIVTSNGNVVEGTEILSNVVSLNKIHLLFSLPPVNLPSHIYYLVGKLQGWSDKNKTCLLYAETAMVQSYTTQWNDDANLKIWLGSDFVNWDNAYGTANDGDNSANGKLAGSGAIVCPEPGALYTFKVDFSTMTYSWIKLANQNPTKFEKVGLIGVGGDWENDVDMTEVTPHNWFIETTLPAGSFKIRANHKWNGGGNWGFVENQEYKSTGKLTNDGNSKDIKVAAGKYSIFFNDITCEYAFIAE